MQIRVAITGGIGSGKSTAMKIISSLGFSCFSCDEIYREICSTIEYVDEVEKLFPNCVKNGKIINDLLANRIFQNEEELKKLNDLAHPLILKRLEQKLLACSEKYVFIEVPLLFESDWVGYFDAIFVVIRALSRRIQAIKERDGLSEEKIFQRIQNQFDYEIGLQVGAFLDKNIYCIENNSDENALALAVQNLIDKLINMKH